MKYRIIFTDSYLRRAKKFFSRHQSLLGAYGKVLELLSLNPSHPSLRLHRLSGKLDGLYSVSITMSYRMTIEFLVHDNAIVPVNIGSHDEVY